jgi:hypothetical protein
VKLFYFFCSHSCTVLSVRSVAANGLGGLAKLGLDCIQFGLSLPVNRFTATWAKTLPPNFAKPLVELSLRQDFISCSIIQ